MKIETIPADEVIKMTKLLHRAFNAAGCNPMCHCCEKMIPVNANFKLAKVQDLSTPVYVDWQVKNPKSTHYGEPEHKTSTTLVPKFDKSHEVMLCENCSAEDYHKKQMKEYHSEVKRITAPRGGCFRIDGKIIH